MESGWSFSRVVHFDVRHVSRQNENEIFLGEGKTKKEPFHEDVKKLFNRLVFDPAPFLEVGFASMNLCLPASVLLCLHSKLGPPLRSLTKKKMSDELQSLAWQSFVDPAKNGIPLQSITAFEKTLHPIPQKLLHYFPLLSMFMGITINIFTMRRNGDAMRIFPVSLSKNSRNPQYFHADILMDGPHLRVPPYNPPSNHCLAIGSLAVLLTRFSGKQNNYRKYTHICRACGYTTMTASRLRDHYSICADKSRGGPLGRRKTKNQIVHSPFRINRYTKKKEKNGLHFERGNSFMLLKNNSMICLDFESYNKSFNEESAGDRDRRSILGNIPKSAIRYQPPMSYAYVHVTLQKHHPLPSSLSEPRFKRLDDENPNNISAEHDFYIALLLSLRMDLLLHFLHLQKILSNDSPPPSVSERTDQIQSFIQKVPRCMLCGSKFGTKKISPFTNRAYKIKRTWDHDHYGLTSNELRLVLCQVSEV